MRRWATRLRSRSRACDRARPGLCPVPLAATLPLAATSRAPPSPAPGLARLPSRTRAAAAPSRSEEHTSELQSPCNLVCRLLLEKKKQNTTLLHIHSQPSVLELRQRPIPYSLHTLRNSQSALAKLVFSLPIHNVSMTSYC